MAISNWSPQSQRNEPSISPVRHCEWIRTSGTPFVTLPKTSASAVSTRRSPFEISRSNAMARNIPHLVGIRVLPTRRTVPACALGFTFVFWTSAWLSNGRRFLNSGEIRRALLKKRRKCLLGFRGADALGEFLVLELYRPLNLLAR